MGVEMSRVFVVQQPMRRTDSGGLAPTFDLTPALEYGELELLLDTGVIVGIAMAPIVRVFKEKLADFSDDDYIVPTGDPSAMGVAIAIAAQHNAGRVALLRWDRKQRKYVVLRVEI